MDSIMGESLTIPDAARLCHVHETTIRRRIASGKLRSVREGGRLRVLEADLERAGTVEAEKIYGGEKGRPFTTDDPIFQLIGSYSDPDSAWVSRDKYRALAGAYSTRP